MVMCCFCCLLVLFGRWSFGWLDGWSCFFFSFSRFIYGTSVHFYSLKTSYLLLLLLLLGQPCCILDLFLFFIFSFFAF